MSKLNKSIVAEFESAQITRELPQFSQGDTIVVNVKVKEGTRERVQAYEGVVIATKNGGLNSSFTVRKISHGYGVERVFQTHSAIIDSVEVKRRGKVRAGSCTTCVAWKARLPASRKIWLLLPPPRLPVWQPRADKQLRLLPRRPPLGGRLRLCRRLVSFNGWMRATIDTRRTSRWRCASWTVPGCHGGKRPPCCTACCGGWVSRFRRRYWPVS